MDPAHEVAQLAHRALGLVVRAGQQRVDGRRVLGQLRARPAQLHRDVGEPVLRPVVQVALDPAQPGVGGLDGAGAARLERRDPLGHLLALLVGEQPVRQRAAADARAPRVTASATAAISTLEAATAAASQQLRSPSSEPSGAPPLNTGASSAATAADHSVQTIRPLTIPTGPSSSR